MDSRSTHYYTCKCSYGIDDLKESLSNLASKLWRIVANLPEFRKVDLLQGATSLTQDCPNFPSDRQTSHDMCIVSLNKPMENVCAIVEPQADASSYSNDIGMKSSQNLQITQNILKDLFELVGVSCNNRCGIQLNDVNQGLNDSSPIITELKSIIKGVFSKRLKIELI